MRKNKLGFLSRNILLEETGLPGINYLIIITIFTIVCAFIIWANFLNMDEISTIDGALLVDSKEKVPSKFAAFIEEKDFNQFKSGQNAQIKIPKISNKIIIQGVIENINKEVIIERKDKKYYEAIINVSDEEKSKISQVLIKDSVSITVDVITGSRTLFEYLLKPMMKSLDNSFKEK